MRPRTLARAGASALGVLLATALAGATLVPMYGAIQGGQRLAHLDEFHVVARELARRTLVQLAGLPYQELEGRMGILPPPSAPEALGPEVQRRWSTVAAHMNLEVSFEELEPGFGKLQVAARWTDATSRVEKTVAVARFVEDPFHWRRTGSRG